MGALREATRTLNGSVDVHSTLGQRTTLRFLFDLPGRVSLMGAATPP